MNTNLQIEPKIGETITINSVKYITQLASDAGCSECAFCDSYCWNIACNHASRKDCKAVIFKKVETNMNEVKIQIPDNCELVRNGDTYIVREKKQAPPKSWEEFCEKYPKQKGECFIGNTAAIRMYDEPSARYMDYDKNICTSKEEAEAFLALMQLRQLRKTWVGDWKFIEAKIAYGILCAKDGSLEIAFYDSVQRNLLFPTREMAEEFLNCFKELCETAKILL